MDQLSTDQRAEFGSEVLQPLRPHPLAYMYDALAEEAWLQRYILENATVDLAWAACFDDTTAASAAAPGDAAPEAYPDYAYYYEYGHGRPAKNMGPAEIGFGL